MIEKLLIANRGEIAFRIIQTARREGMETFVICSESDRESFHTRQADRSLCVGSSYLDIPKIIEMAQKAGIDAIHPGYGFLSENAEFARACADAGISFVGPSPEALEVMGSKSEAKVLVEKAGVSITSGYHGDDQSLETLIKEAHRIGYPLMIKAVLGGGGKGMRRVETADEFEQALASCQREALSAFGDQKVLLEKYLHHPRHIEVQIFGDTQGSYVHVFDRDCSLQRRHQKIIEEAPAVGLRDEVREAMSQAALKIAQAIDYVGAGTVEFLVDQDQNFYFMEMNTRLQVEHTVTEEITGIDLVGWQLKVAAGDPLPLTQDQITCQGHAIEMRLYAEDPDHDFLPSTGQLSIFDSPFDGSYRLDVGVEVGDKVTPHYDPLLAKLIVWGEDREKALDMSQYSMNTWPILGVQTNANFLNELLQDSDILKGPVDVGFVDRNLDRWTQTEKNLKVVSRCAAIGLHASLKETVDPWSDTTGWRLGDASPQTYCFERYGQDLHVSLQYKGDRYWIDDEDWVTFEKIGDALRIQCSKAQLDAYFVRRDKSHCDVWFRGQSYTLCIRTPLEPKEKVGNQDTHLSAPMTSKVVALHVNEGDQVLAGQSLVVVEAMKMEYAIKAPSDGIIGKVFYAVGDVVEEGIDLLEFEGGDDDTPVAKAS